MGDTEKYPALPQNADKVLFAEDFVNHALLRHQMPLLSSGIADHRALIYNAFTPQVKLATNFVSECLEEDIMLEYINLLIQKDKGIKAFRNYVVTLKSQTLELMLPIESGAGSLMHFCVKISTMAAKFYEGECKDAPDLAVFAITDIIDDIDMVEEGGWKALNAVAAEYAQISIDEDNNNLTPESVSDFDMSSSNSSSRGNSDASLSSDHDENDSSSRLNSDASLSPDHEVDGGDDHKENEEKLTDDDFCKTCIAAMSTSSERPVSSSSICKHVEKTIDVISENIARFSDNTSNSSDNSSGSSEEKNSEASLNSFEETSSGNDTSKQKIRKMQKKKPSHSYSKNSDSDSDKGEKDLKTTDYIYLFGKELTEKHSTILSSPVNELHESDSAHHFKESSSDNIKTEDINNASSMEEGDRVNSSRAKLSPMREPLPKRRK